MSPCTWVQATCTPTVKRQAMTATTTTLALLGAKKVEAIAPAVRKGENPQMPEYTADLKTFK